MKMQDCSIVFVPGLGGSGTDHWQSRWAEKMRNSVTVEQADWDAPVKADWVEALVQTVEAAPKPVVLVAHSLGVITVLHSTHLLPRTKVMGAYLVAPPDLDNALQLDFLKKEFGPVPMDPLLFPSSLVASRDDLYCRYERAEDFSYAWGSKLIDAGEAGHINAESNYGPWPEGIIRFAAFLARL